MCVRACLHTTTTTARNNNHNPISRIASTLIDIADTWVDKKKEKKWLCDVFGYLWKCRQTPESQWRIWSFKRWIIKEGSYKPRPSPVLIPNWMFTNGVSPKGSCTRREIYCLSSRPTLPMLFSTSVIIAREDVHRLHTRVILSKLKFSRLPNDSSAVIIRGPEWPARLCSEQQSRPLVQTLNDWGGNTTQVILRRDTFTSLPPLKRCSFSQHQRCSSKKTKKKTLCSSCTSQRAFQSLKFYLYGPSSFQCKCSNT